MDWLFRGRQGGAVCGVAQRLRHDPGGGPLHGTACTPPVSPSLQSKQMWAACSGSPNQITFCSRRQRFKSDIALMVCCPLSAESSSGEHETLRRHLQQRFLPQHIHGEKLSSHTLPPVQEERCSQTNKNTYEDVTLTEKPNPKLFKIPSYTKILV